MYGNGEEGLRGPLDCQGPSNRGSGLTVAPPVGSFDSAGQVVGPTQSIVRVQGGDVGGLMSVTLGLKLNANSVSPPGFDEVNIFTAPIVRAVIQFGSGTVKNTVVADWNNGTVLSIAAEDVTVAAQYIRQTRPWNPIDHTLDVDPTFNLTAMLGYQSVGHNSNPARLTYLVQLENSADTPNQEIEIPEFAQSFTVIPITDADMVVQLRTWSAGYRWNYDIASPLTNVGQDNVENTFPIPNGARFLRVENPGVDEFFCWVIFGLSL